MRELKRVNHAIIMVLLALCATFALSGCSSPQLPKGMIGRLGKYDYSPSVIQTGNVRNFWWCGIAKNPTDSSQETDAILYESVDMITGKHSGPITVMAETRHAWDSEFTCNPKVIEGIFVDPLGDGQTYQFALYYVGIEPTTNNNIGVAFSHDGIAWKKYPSPVIRASSPAGYGVGQPALYNSDHKSGITMFYEDDNPVVHHVKATSSDGVHFTLQGTITVSGLESGLWGTWGDMAYDAKTGYWYALFDRTIRDPSTTGGVTERGQLGVELYRIADSSLMTGDKPWQLLSSIDTNVTGFESNFIGALVSDGYGTVNVGAYPTIQMYVSVSDPQPGWSDSPKQAALSADPSTWDIAPVEWKPNSAAKPLNRYFNGEAYLVTTGWVNQYGGFQQQKMLGHVYEGPHGAATASLFSCIDGDKDYFVSTDGNCEGKRILGRNGFAYAQQSASPNLVAIYRCRGKSGHFVSQDQKCEGETNDGFLAYVEP